MNGSATSNFLVPDATLVIEVVAFNLVLFVVAKYVLPPLRAAVEARQAQVAATLALKAETDRLRQNAEAEARELLAEAHREARRVTDQARATRDELIAQGRREGLAEYQWLAGRAAREAARTAQTKGQLPPYTSTPAAVAARRTTTNGAAKTLAVLIDDDRWARVDTSRTTSPTAATRGETHDSRALSADDPANQPAEAGTRA